MPVPDAFSPRETPLLRHDDRMSRREFERRWALSPTIKLAELIDGVVRVPGPRPHTQHGGPAFDLIAILGMYAGSTAHVHGGAHPSLRLDHRNEPQPAAVLMVDRIAGVTAPIDEEGFINGPPELVADVVPGHDFKLAACRADLYHRFKGGEYVIWWTTARRIEHLVWLADRYHPIAAAADGLLRSERFPGLRINTDALLAGDAARAAADVQRGIASPERPAFVADLARRRAAAERS